MKNPGMYPAEKEVMGMTQKDLRKLSRLALLDLLIDMSTELQTVKERLAQTEAMLQDRKIAIDKAGSIAEASLQVNGVYVATEAACQQYMDNIRLLSERQERLCAQRDRESKAQAEELLAKTRKTCENMEKNTKIYCDNMVTKARAESRQCWKEVSEKLEAYYAQHMGLREMLSMIQTKAAE